MRWLGKGFNPDFVIRVFLIHCPPEKSGGYFRNLDEVEYTAGTALGRLRAVF